MTEWNDQVPTASDLLANSQAYQDLMNTIQNMINSFNANQGNAGTEVHPTTDELDQFRKSWFYNNWSVRFRRLMSFTPLGTRGVIAIPNTTFEEWLWWFHEWMQAFMEDYNAFKKLVMEAMQAIEKHLELIDKEIDDIMKHLQAIDNHLKQLDDEIAAIQQHLNQIDNEINQINQKLGDLQNQINQINQKLGDLTNRVSNLENEYNDLNRRLNDLQDKLNDLQNQVNQNDANHKAEEQHLQDEIDAIWKQLHNNIAPNWINASDEGAGAVNGWAVDTNSNPRGFNVQYRWINQDDHSQGLYLNINYNHVYNNSYSPGTDDTIMKVDLTNFVNQTHAIIPQEQWPSSTGSYYTSQQRSGFGLHWTYDNNSHIMTIGIDYRDGVYSADKWPDKIVLINGSTNVYCPVSQS